MVNRKNKALIQILKVLRNDGGSVVSGTKLAQSLGVSRTIVSRYVRSLEAMGYRFEKKSGIGYRLIQVPDALHEIEVLSLLQTNRMGRNYYFYPELPSTNDKIMELVLGGKPEGTCVVADSQTKGRGRLGRSWLSMPGKGIYLSLLLQPDIPPRNVHHITFLAALSLVDILKNLYSLEAKLKWPNDVVVAGKKLAGILSEGHVEPQKVRFVILGIGINVHYSKEDFSGDFRYPPTSVAIEYGSSKEIRRQMILTEFLRVFEINYEAYLKKGWKEWTKKLYEESMLLGKEVVVDTGEASLRGIVRGFSDEGGMILEKKDGTYSTLWVGDVIRVKNF